MIVQIFGYAIKFTNAKSIYRIFQTCISILGVVLGDEGIKSIQSVQILWRCVCHLQVNNCKDRQKRKNIDWYAKNIVSASGRRAELVFVCVLHHDDVHCCCRFNHLCYCHHLPTGKDSPGVYPRGSKNVHHLVQGRKFDWRRSLSWMDILPWMVSLCCEYSFLLTANTKKANPF